MTEPLTANPRGHGPSQLPLDAVGLLGLFMAVTPLVFVLLGVAVVGGIACWMLARSVVDAIVSMTAFLMLVAALAFAVLLCVVAAVCGRVVGFIFLAVPYFVLAGFIASPAAAVLDAALQGNEIAVLDRTETLYALAASVYGVTVLALLGVRTYRMFRYSRLTNARP